MDPLSALRMALPSASPERPEGSIESVDERRGTVVIRLATGETLEAQGTGGLVVGDKVFLQKVSDGLWLARPLAQNRASTTAIALPPGLASLPGAGDLAQAVRSGEPSRIRNALASIAEEIADGSLDTLPSELRAAKSRGLSPLASLGGRPLASGGAEAVPLSLLEEVSAGTYRAEAAGRSLVLLGAAGLASGSAGLWTESVASGIVSLWTPVELGTGEAPGLPARIGADASGARRLLDRLGVAAPDVSDPSFRSLVKTLARAAILAAGGTSAEVALPSAAASRGSAEESSPSPGIAARAETPSAASAAPIKSVVADSVSPGAASPVKTGKAGNAPVPSDIVLVESPSASAAEVESRPAAPPASPVGGATPAASRVPSPSSVDTRSLGSVAALRVVCAWALSDGDPSDAVLAAALGAVDELPETIRRLADRALAEPARFPEIAAFLAESDPERPLMPRKLGLDASGRGGDREGGATLASAVVGDLARSLKEERTADAQVLREALRGILGEGLAGAKDVANPMASAAWSMPPQGERPDSGHVVVRDRRQRRGRTPERTVVEVSMAPTGLGAVGARLEAVGKELDVRFRAKEPGTAEKIRDALPELRQILSGLGYETRGLDVEGGGAIATPPDARRPGMGFLDIRA